MFQRRERKPKRANLTAMTEATAFATPSRGPIPAPSLEATALSPQTAGFDFSTIPVIPPERQIGREGGVLNPVTSARIQAQRGGGAPLEPTVQRRMEDTLGHTFADVRVHADGESETLSRSVGARAFVLGSDIFLSQEATSAGLQGGDELLAHELTHVVQQRGAASSGSLTVGAAADARERRAEGMGAMAARGAMPIPIASSITSSMTALLPLQQQAVQRDPQPHPDSKATGHASQDVRTAYGHLFANQRSGLQRLHDALQKESPDKNLLATVAAAAVGGALTALLGPVGPAAAATFAMAEDKVTQTLIEKSAALVTEKAVDMAKEQVTSYIAKSTKTDAIDNLIESQGLAINDAEDAALKAWESQIDGIEAQPDGLAAIRALEGTIEAQARIANSLQIAHSAGAWAMLIAKPGDDSKAWANDDHENYAEKGALELEVSVANAPLRGPDSLRITASNWKGINKETERVIQEHAGAKISDLGANLRIIISTPVGETRCEILPGSSNPIVPEKSTMQDVMGWLGSGQMKSSTDPMAVVSYAAMVGSYVQQKSVTDLKFG